ncbi:MAG: hypothetical protein IM638_11480 [Bacteroidetes bacterium]|nr:hypothetical protein [Bacteroidota bacterium]
MLLLLLRSQQQGDIIVIRRYLNMMRDGETVLSQLLDFMIERPTIPPTELERITADEFGNDYNKRVYELREKVIHAMNTDWYTQRAGRFSERTQVRATLKQKLDAADIIWQMSDSMATWLLQRVIAQAEKYELYGELSRALMIARQNLSLRLTSEEYSSVSSQIENTRKAEDGVLLASRLREEAGHRQRKTNEKEFEWHDLAISKIFELEKESKSKTIRFYRFLLQADLHSQQKHWDKSSELLSEAWQLVEKEKALNLPHLKISVRLLQADNLLFAGHFDAALKAAQSASQQIKAENFNWLVAKKLEADALFYSGKYKEASLIYKMVIKHPNGNYDENYKDILRYSIASSSVAEGNYQGAISVLNDITILPRQNKTGFNLAVRGLHALCLIALDDHAQLFDEMQKQRVYYSRLSVNSQVSPRNVALFRILLGYASNRGIDHSRVFTDRAEHIENLRTGANGCEWQPNGFEMIVYDQFLDALAAGEQYDFMLPDYLYRVG